MGHVLGEVLPTQAMAGAKGYITALITKPPRTELAWSLDGAPGNELWIRNTDGTLIPHWARADKDGSATVTWHTAGYQLTFYLVPEDGAGNSYAAAETLAVTAAPGIYASPSTPASVVKDLQSSNPGLQVYGWTPAAPQDQAPPAASDPLAYLDTLPGGRWPWLAGGALGALLLLRGRKP